jgi:hypothetical protein
MYELYEYIFFPKHKIPKGEVEIIFAVKVSCYIGKERNEKPFPQESSLISITLHIPVMARHEFGKLMNAPILMRSLQHKGRNPNSPSQSSPEKIL